MTSPKPQNTAECAVNCGNVYLDGEKELLYMQSHVDCPKTALTEHIWMSVVVLCTKPL